MQKIGCGFKKTKQMIQATDLRIGNIIKRFSGESDEILGYKIETVTAVSKDLLGTTFLKKDYTGPWHPINEYEGIKLTPEVLEKCGFVKNGDDLIQEISENTFLCKYHDSSKVFLFHDFKSATNYLAVVEYLHQIQNLYHALTGHELNYTP